MKSNLIEQIKFALSAKGVAAEKIQKILSIISFANHTLVSEDSLEALWKMINRSNSVAVDFQEDDCTIILTLPYEPLTIPILSFGYVETVARGSGAIPDVWQLSVKIGQSFSLVRSLMDISIGPPSKPVSSLSWNFFNINSGEEFSSETEKYALSKMGYLYEQFYATPIFLVNDKLMDKLYPPRKQRGLNREKTSEIIRTYQKDPFEIESLWQKTRSLR